MNTVSFWKKEAFGKSLSFSTITGVAKTCQPIGANFSRPALIFKQPAANTILTDTSALTSNTGYVSTSEQLTPLFLAWISKEFTLFCRKFWKCKMHIFAANFFRKMVGANLQHFVTMQCTSGTKLSCYWAGIMFQKIYITHDYSVPAKQIQPQVLF